MAGEFFLKVTPAIGFALGTLLILLAYQQWRLYRLRQQASKREELFRIVAENAADMIALVDTKGHRLYNSPAYQKVLGYSPEELKKTSSFDQIHIEDRFRVLDAARDARTSGVGKKLEYRIRHKNGSWRVLESTASTIKNQRGEVEKLVIVNRDITERKKAEEQIEYNSFHDGLTGLPNRRLFLDRLQRAFARAQRNPEYSYAVLFVDVDGFNTVNETLGPSAGDKVISEIAQRLASCLRTDDTVARPKGKLPISDAVLSRLGGDEFTLLVEGVKNPSNAMRVARRIQAAVSAPFVLEGQTMAASASIGIALSTPQLQRAEDLLQEADTAMRRAKSLGGSRCELFDLAMHSRAEKRLQLEAELRNALQQNQFRLLYQPIVKLDTHEPTAFNALLLWQHPEQGAIASEQFLDVAEDIGLVLSLGKWVLEETCRQMRSWRDQQPHMKAFDVVIPVCRKQFRDPGFVNQLRTAMQAAAIEPSSIQLEIAEADAMADPEFTAEVLALLKHAGVRISLGDFGKSSSSLAWLRRWPLDQLRIHRSLIARVPADAWAEDVARVMVLLGHEMKLRVVADGIETAAQVARLVKSGFEYGTGRLLSEPLDAEAAKALLQQYESRAKAKTAALI